MEFTIIKSGDKRFRGVKKASVPNDCQSYRVTDVRSSERRRHCFKFAIGAARVRRVWKQQEQSSPQPRMSTRSGASRGCFANHKLDELEPVDEDATPSTYAAVETQHRGSLHTHALLALLQLRTDRW